jgi:pimeloyl-ACP methyl ester carboxylesterase
MWKMKSRAGTVGAKGVSQLVRAVLEHDDTRLHLVGHSYGARVVLASLVTGDAPPNKAHSVLLLQPAINRWCFATDVAGRGFKGGFNPALDRVRQPVVTTFSSHDSPLTKFFHLAAVGRKHLGEPDIAAVGNTELYGALGGFGPAGLGNLAATEKALPPGTQRYDLDAGRRVIAVNGGVNLDGKPAISNHGDISNPVTWWAMHCLTTP